MNLRRNKPRHALYASPFVLLRHIMVDYYIALGLLLGQKRSLIVWLVVLKE